MRATILYILTNTLEAAELFGKINSCDFINVKMIAWKPKQLCWNPTDLAKKIWQIV